MKSLAVGAVFLLCSSLSYADELTVPRGELEAALEARIDEVRRERKDLIRLLRDLRREKKFAESLPERRARSRNPRGYPGAVTPPLRLEVEAFRHAVRMALLQDELRGRTEADLAREIKKIGDTISGLTLITLRLSDQENREKHLLSEQDILEIVTAWAGKTPEIKRQRTGEFLITHANLASSRVEAKQTEEALLLVGETLVPPSAMQALK